MGQDREAAAIERLERALSRLEVAATRQPGTVSGENQELSELKDAYRALRRRVEGTVGDIDRLLATAERG